MCANLMALRKGMMYNKEVGEKDVGFAVFCLVDFFRLDFFIAGQSLVDIGLHPASFSRCGLG